tara:strand:+ start:179 stop:361 length:183 start_codon:yes stop_codon:yes gene_type:complete
LILLNWRKVRLRIAPACKEQLAPYKVAGRFDFMRIPRTSTGKIKKFFRRKLARDIAQKAD